MAESSTLIVGAGHAGVAASYHLKQANVEHVVLERGRAGETWLSKRKSGVFYGMGEDAEYVVRHLLSR